MQTISVSDQCWLTELRPTDVPQMVEHFDDPELYHNIFLSRRRFTTKTATTFLAIDRKMRDRYQIDVNWAIRDADGRLIGGIGRMMLSGQHGHRDQIGYWLAAPFRGKGVMTAVVRSLCDHLFQLTPLIRISAQVLPTNSASMHVLEEAGFQKEGVLRNYVQRDDKYVDMVLYARLK